MSLDESSSDVDEGEEGDERGDGPPQVERELMLPGSEEGVKKKRASQSDEIAEEEEVGGRGKRARRSENASTHFRCGLEGRVLTISESL